VDEKDILVVDDSEGIRIVFEKALTEAGLRYEDAPSNLPGALKLPKQG